MKVAICTLGCKVNQYETQAMEQELRRRGHEIVDFSSPADAYVVNSCSVTAVSDRKSRQQLSRVRREHPAAVAALCGCYVQTHLEEVRHLDVDLLAGTGGRMEFLDRLESAVMEKQCQQSREQPREFVDQALQRREFEPLPAGGLEGRTRAMLKVEDGCVNFCSYCIIPYARGPVRSLPLPQAAEEIKRLREEGYQEVVLTVIEISSWGQDFRNCQSLVDLLEDLSAAAPELRLRLGSLEPRTVTEDFCRRAAALPGLCPQFHLSLQSGCDATLKRMNRKYDTSRFAQSVALLNQYFEHPAITTDLITGFPEETEEEFSETLAFLRRCGFARLHVFPYSIRPGTPAAKMAQVPKAVKEERARRAIALGRELHGEYLAACIGKSYPVLFEQPSGNRFSGHAPNYMEVLVDTREDLHNRILPVRITGTEGDALLGVIVEGSLPGGAQR